MECPLTGVRRVPPGRRRFRSLDSRRTGSGGNGAGGSAPATGGKAIYVLTPSEGHGWTGSVATFAKAKIAEINDEVTYTAELQTADSAEK